MRDIATIINRHRQSIYTKIAQPKSSTYLLLRRIEIGWKSSHGQARAYTHGQCYAMPVQYHYLPYTLSTSTCKRKSHGLISVATFIHTPTRILVHTYIDTLTQLQTTYTHTHTHIRRFTSCTVNSS